VVTIHRQHIPLNLPSGTCVHDTSYTHFTEPAKEESGDVVTIHRQHIPLNLPSGTCVHDTSYTHFTEPEIKDTTNTDRSASYLDLHLEIDNEGRLRTKHCDNRDDFNFPIVNFPFICSNIPAAPTCGVYISQLIRYYRACGSYQDFSGTSRFNLVINHVISHE
jgi:hypothetical protein